MLAAKAGHVLAAKARGVCLLLRRGMLCVRPVSEGWAFRNVKHCVYVGCVLHVCMIV